MKLNRRHFLAGTGAVLVPAQLLSQDLGTALQPSETWDLFAEDILGDAQPITSNIPFEIDAPKRAEDAALVPIRIRQTDPSIKIDRLQLIIDENPSPVAGDFNFGDSILPLDFETRIRVNQYSNVRVIAYTADAVYMDGRFVKASGGCSAPASKDPEEARAGLGKMKLRLFESENQEALPASGTRRNAQINIRHPNNSGLQRDQITQLYIPAFFISRIEVRQGDDLLFTMDGGISISENPSFRFDYVDNGAEKIDVIAEDTDGDHFEVALAK